MLVVFYGLLAVFIQPVVPAVFGIQNLVVGLVPVIIGYCAMRGSDGAIVVFVLGGGLLYDFLTLNAPGMGPLLWGLTAFIVRTQRGWLSESHMAIHITVAAAASFLFFAFERLLYLAVRTNWSWDFELTYSMTLHAVANALICPLFFWMLDLLLDMIALGRKRGKYYSYADS